MFCVLNRFFAPRPIRHMLNNAFDLLEASAVPIGISKRQLVLLRP
ncbi:hypothetical protein CES85_2905 (plasmid) [Ochrobactrum quorumnocens]|uniref:Uncharacterized protein n=1 Tax=Ochrobactrum quorumnocens TaxID=271865 RepID=A0A248UNW3_9HYPH|nr:hypothetical protein CES85_2905 [[Ochrobactrum] quorumnocens]